MDPNLEAIFEEWDKGKGDRDESLVRSLSDQFVADNPVLFGSFTVATEDNPDGMPEPACIQALEVFRNAGMLEEERRVQVWLWHRFSPKNIGGEVKAQIRIPTNA